MKKVSEDIDNSYSENKDNKTFYTFKINNLKSDTEMKIKSKLTNVLYPEVKTEFSDELIFRTKCNGDLYTSKICKTKDSNVLGPTELSKYGKVDIDKKDPDVTKWPFIKIPDDVDGNICGCRAMNDDNEIKEWCKNNIYKNINISEDRQIILEENSCKLGLITVGPVENFIIQVLNINEDLVKLKPDNFRKDFPNRILIKWSLPLESIKKSGNGADAVPSKYLIERQESGKDWKLVHEYIVNDEKNYFELDCSKNLSCTKENINTLNKIEGFNNFEMFSEVETTKSNVLEPRTFGWIDGDYSENSYFKPNKLSDYSSNPLKSDTEYKYKIIPVNNAGNGLEMILTIKTDLPRIESSECDSATKEDPDSAISFDGFKKIINSTYTKCISMPPISRDLVCSNITYLDEKTNKTTRYMYDTENKKCAKIDIDSLKKPDIPIVNYNIINNNQIELEIQPALDKGKPYFTSYIITWENQFSSSSSTPGEKSGKLLNLEGSAYYKNKINQSGANISLNLFTSEPKGENGIFVELPTQWYDEPDTKLSDNEIIHAIHKTDTDGNPLKYATKYKYQIYAVTRSQFFNDLVSTKTSEQEIINRLLSLDGVEKNYKIRTYDLTITTQFGPPFFQKDISTGKLKTIMRKIDEFSESSNRSKIKFSIDAFKSGNEGGSKKLKTRIKKYKLLRSHIDKNSNKIKDFMLTFDFSDFLNFKISKFDYSTNLNEEITDMKLYEIKSDTIRSI